jgi:hypothetical protein
MEKNMPIDHQSFTDEAWQTAQMPNEAKADGADDASRTLMPHMTPFYWGAKDAPQKYGAKGQALLDRLEKFVKVPLFMDPANRPMMARTPEYWFAPADAGAMAHMDPHCMATMSVQLSGSKQWRVGPVPSTHPKTVKVIWLELELFPHGWLCLCLFAPAAASAPPPRV